MVVLVRLGRGKKGTTMVIEPQLTATQRLKKLHINARDKINAAQLVQHAQSGNLGTVTQSFCQSGNDTTIANNHLSGFSVLVEVVGDEDTSIDDLSIQCRPKHEELTSLNPILTISSRKDMVGGEALKVAKHEITNPCSLGGSCLVPTP